MPAIKAYNEGSAVTATFYFYNEAGELAIPASIRYRVDCQTTGEAMVEWMSLTPATSAVVTIPASVNILRDQNNRKERKEVTVEADAGLTTAYVGYGYYDIRNRLGVT